MTKAKKNTALSNMISTPLQVQFPSTARGADLHCLALFCSGLLCFAQACMRLARNPWVLLLCRIDESSTNKCRTRASAADPGTFICNVAWSIDTTAFGDTSLLAHSPPPGHWLACILPLYSGSLQLHPSCSLSCSPLLCLSLYVSKPVSSLIVAIQVS